MARKNKGIQKGTGKDNFVFIADGKCESWYIQLIKRNEPQLRKIQLEPKLPGTKTVTGYFETAKYLSKYYSRVFWMVDFDTIMKETREAPTGKPETALQEFKRYYECLKKEYTNVVVIINNPCLEYWYLLHFEKTNKYFKDYKSLKPIIEKYIPNYAKTKDFYLQANDIYKRLKPQLKDAVANAKSIKEIDFDNPCGMAQMHLLFEAQIESKKILELLS